MWGSEDALVESGSLLTSLPGSRDGTETTGLRRRVPLPAEPSYLLISAAFDVFSFRSVLPRRFAIFFFVWGELIIDVTVHRVCVPVS